MRSISGLGLGGTVSSSHVMGPCFCLFTRHLTPAFQEDVPRLWFLWMSRCTMCVDEGVVKRWMAIAPLGNRGKARLVSFHGLNILSTLNGWRMQVLGLSPELKSIKFIRLLLCDVVYFE
ncbi:hypothetical protein BS50DRAFT_339249 [Corynespora cassiicola Philippines]|uniref:Uncharacterized protein n=1 Tax=Corynespora cassiicola Philippines TaxID=1448308 RepID=A0A2T2NV86_CORCC|nr:hypothetical protein BS50DRAFT_339249 [Corynespora cassiicola Philippines]